ncbi:L-threonine dehydratase biosynthetic IlvA [Phytophthora cinnamomi]|uniref:L-threonine dehydratase biosynthetic IlvA n=1 Tax=Phytophthora cinnamomi TaxID=4785 RepID=UPI002A32D8BA|nr:L-threonine dehydratase biosynthetic IlvA [Phytophthora cinnamomi]KAJ8561956.1 hypothetical protein ON010_g7721 [Phytophthora cinnamomi]
MGKSTDRIATEQEFSKLELLLIQTADDAANCLKVLKGNLAEYGSRHGLRFVNTSKSILRGDIRAAKDTASELRNAANQIAERATPSESEVAAARSAMNATSDVMNELVAAGCTYDKNNLKSRGIAGAMTDMLGGGNKDLGKRCEGEHVVEYTKRVGILRAPDTVEEVLASTMRDCFSGFSPLKLQISAAEESLSPLFAERSQ